MSEIQFPATQTVHTPNGPTNACDEHASKVAALFQFLGAHVNSTVLEAPAECENCMNEHKAGKR